VVIAIAIATHRFCTTALVIWEAHDIPGFTMFGQATTGRQTIFDETPARNVCVE
jgi:hypothetical protein